MAKVLINAKEYKATVQPRLSLTLSWPRLRQSSASEFREREVRAFRSKAERQPHLHTNTHETSRLKFNMAQPSSSKDTDTRWRQLELQHHVQNQTEVCYDLSRGMRCSVRHQPSSFITRLSKTLKPRDITFEDAARGHGARVDADNTAVLENDCCGESLEGSGLDPVTCLGASNLVPIDVFIQSAVDELAKALDLGVNLPQVIV